MYDNYLLIVEGKKTEPNIFEKVLVKYVFNVIKSETPITVDDEFHFEKTEIKKNEKNVVIIQGPRNRIHDFLILYNEHSDSLERVFSNAMTTVKGIFLMYDVDHNDNKDVEEMFNRFPDESSGLLLLSSPCIEVLGEYDYNRSLFYNNLKEYKSDLNIHYNKEYGNAENYIVENFEKLCIHFLDYNYKTYNAPNIMEHPQLIISKINEDNKRVNYPKDSPLKSYVIYNYLTTVVYVFLAYINGLTREIDNYEIVRNFLLNL